MSFGLWRNATLATMAGDGIGVVPQGALAVEDGRIAHAGPEAELPARLRDLPATDCNGGWILPAFIDCHTHLVFAGTRAREFEMRPRGPPMPRSPGPAGHPRLRQRRRRGDRR